VSTAAVTWAMQQELGATAKLVLLTLANRANDEHEAWPSVERIRRECSLSHASNVRRILRNLEDRRLLARRPWHRRDGAQTSNRYLLAVTPEARAQVEAILEGGRAPRPSPPGRAALLPRAVEPSPPGRTARGPRAPRLGGPGPQGPPEPSGEPSGEPSSVARASARVGGDDEVTGLVTQFLEEISPQFEIPEPYDGRMDLAVEFARVAHQGGIPTADGGAWIPSPVEFVSLIREFEPAIDVADELAHIREEALRRSEDRRPPRATRPAA